MMSDFGPLSFAQERLWFLDQLQPDSPPFGLFKAVRLEGTLDVSALRHALEAIVIRHESLRTTFVAVDGDPRQGIAESQTLEVPVIDLRGLSPNERDGGGRGAGMPEGPGPFRLGEG